MTLVFVTNFVHHHQLPVADEFYKLIGDNYYYIATDPLPDWLIKGGYDPTLERPYIIRTYSSNEEMEKARNLIDSCDVVIAGASPLSWYNTRKKEGKVTFHCSERIYKERTPWLSLPKAAVYNYLHYGRYKRTYLLCASAFAAYDFNLSGCFIGRCFKWGYMTSVDHINVLDERTKLGRIKLMWCARFIWWKHPELPVILAKRLSDKGYNFEIDMFGGGEKYDEVESLIKELGVEDYVHLRGNCPNSQIINEMQRHHIFVFTSDRNEGWGAVLNEAMSTGCVPVAGDEIGSVPYLIDNGKNGLTFRSNDLDSLEESVRLLLDNPRIIPAMSDSAIKTMREVWSPRKAAENFMDLSSYALNNNLKDYNRKVGPASWND